MNEIHGRSLRILNKKKSYSLRILLALVLLSLSGTSVAYFFVSDKTIGKYLTAFAETRINKRIKYKDLSIHWITFYHLQISASGIKITAPERNETIFSAKQIDCDLNVLSLFRGSVIFEKICIVHPVLFLPASQTPSDAFFFNGPQYEANACWPQPQIEDFELSQGIIVFQDHSNPGDSYLKKQLTLTGLDVKFHNLNIDSIDSFEIRGRSTESKLEGLFEIKGRFSSQNRLEGGKIARNFSAKFSDCPMKPFLILAKFFQIEIPISDANFSFVADASFDSSKWIFSGVSIVSGGFLQSNQLIRSRVPIDKIGARFAGEMSDKLLILDLQEISLPGVVASLKIQLKNRFRSNATLEILVSKAEVDIKRASDFLPMSLFQVSEQDRLKKADLKGHLQIVNSFWINSLEAVRDGNYRNADMGLDVVLSNVSGIIPGYPLPIKEASGFIRLNTSEILFKGIALSIGNSPVVINGWISNLKTNPTVDLFVSANAIASDMRDALLQEPFCRKFGSILKNFQDAQGSAAITMDVKGPLIDPSLKGLIKLEELQFRIEGLPLPVRKLDGDLRFRGSKVSFSAIKGLIGDSAFELRGDMAQFVWNLDLDLKLTGSDIRRFSSFPVGWNVTGNAPVSLSLKGKSSNFNFNGTVDFSPTTIIYESFVRKKTGTKAKLEFSGTSNQGGISVEEAYLITEAGRVFAKAVFNYDGKTLVLVNLPPKGIPTSSLAPFADPALELQSGGRLEGDFSIRKEKNQEPNFDANLIFSHISLRLPRFRKITEGITGSYQSRSKFINVSIERSRTGSSLISGNFSIINGENPILKFVIESEFLDTTDFTAPPGEISSITWQEWIQTNPLIKFLAKCKLSGNVHVIKGKTELRSFDDFRSEMNGVSGLIKAPKWQMSFVDGILRGSAHFDIRSQTVIPFKIDFQGDNLKFDRIFMSDPQRIKVDGDMNVRGNIVWKLRKSLESNGIYKTGTIAAVLKDGIIYRFEILSKIFSLINLGSLIRGRLPDIVGQGLPFQQITWKMEVFDNKWLFRNLKLFSDAARIDASGMYFSDQNRIDFKAKVSPLVGLDAIVSGLFGNLITKDGKLLTTTFRIRGLYSSPDVRLEPFDNLKMEN